jgi:hypothetical protein
MPPSMLGIPQQQHSLFLFYLLVTTVNYPRSIHTSTNTRHVSSQNSADEKGCILHAILVRCFCAFKACVAFCGYRLLVGGIRLSTTWVTVIPLVVVRLLNQADLFLSWLCAGASKIVDSYSIAVRIQRYNPEGRNGIKRVVVCHFVEANNNAEQEIISLTS